MRSSRASLVFGFTMIAAAVAACSGTGDDRMINPGGGGGPNGGSGGNPIDGPQDLDGPQITNRVCLLTDARDFSSCATTGADGITVALGSNSITTVNPDGTFTIALQTGTGLAWHLSGTHIMPSVIRFSAGRSLPAISTAMYDDLEAFNGVQFIDGEAAVFARVAIGATAVAGATATSDPVPTAAILYDDSSATTWTQAATGDFGVVWIPNLLLPNGESSTAKLTIAPPDTGSGSTPTSFLNVPLENQSLTFETLNLP